MEAIKQPPAQGQAAALNAEINAAQARVESLVINATEKSVMFTVPSAKWAERLRLKSEASAIERKLKALDTELGLPKGDSLAEALGLTEADKASVVIVSGNGDVLGKGSVFFVRPTEIPAARWQARYS